MTLITILFCMLVALRCVIASLCYYTIPAEAYHMASAGLRSARLEHGVTAESVEEAFDEFQEQVTFVVTQYLSMCLKYNLQHMGHCDVYDKSIAVSNQTVLRHLFYSKVVHWFTFQIQQ